MRPLRILILSNTRPSRAWRLALRVVNEISGAEIAGIVQRPLRELPFVQQEIIAGTALSEKIKSLFVRVSEGRLHRVRDGLLRAALWWIHGCPPEIPHRHPFTVSTLEGKCASMGWPCLQASSFDQQSVCDFIRRNGPALMIQLGPPGPVTPPAILPAFGLIRVRKGTLEHGAAIPQSATQLLVEYIARDARFAANLASVTLPSQFNDGPVGFTLKADLLGCDLILEALASAVNRGGIPAAEDVSQWTRLILSPYLEQLPPHARDGWGREPRAYCRPLWRLVLETMLLCSPLIVCRNWIRRLRRRYPVLIVAHHLVSDRRHRLGISTEKFWRQVRFLQDHYHIVGLSEAVALMNSGSVASPTVSLTFDDGYADNFVSLRAVADEAEIPVSLFITTEPVSRHTEFQHDVLNGELGALPLTWDQIRYWCTRGAEFGSHTRTHLDCGSADPNRLQDEILGARKELERRLQRSVPYFAFPFGKLENMSDKAVDLARSGYRCFFSFWGGENVPRSGRMNSHLFRKIAYTEPWELELELQSIFDFTGVVRRALARVAGLFRQAEQGSAAMDGCNAQGSTSLR